MGASKMEVVTSIKKMQEICLDLRTKGSTIGFIPTMGYLHEGHLTLMETARKANDIVITSVFVNPLQFGPNEDFDKYPRDAAGDEDKARNVGVDYFFYPHVDEMYPKKLATTMTVTAGANVLCGSSRPGHFDGVVTVLAKLFNLVLPHKVYMGTKDAQQVAVVTQLVADYNVPTEIVPVPTVRESDGLAKSSRNVYLSDEERMQSPKIYAALLNAKAFIEQGETNPKTVITKLKSDLSLIEGAIVDYAHMYSYPALENMTTIDERIVLAVAVKFTNARLIDNIIIEIGE